MASVREESYSPQSLECLYCNDIFTDPKILKCLHSFCRKCLDSYDVIGAGTNSVVCPLCRKPTPIPEDGVQGLPSNFLLNNSLDHHSVKTSKEYTLHCTNCEDEAAANSRCLECSEFLCSKCVMAHRRIRMTKDHRIIPLDTLQAEKQTLHRPSFCPQHEDEMYMFYCSPCERLICRECTILDHRGHKYTGLKEALEERKLVIDDLLNFCIKEKIPPVQDAVHEVKGMVAKLHARAEGVKRDICATTEECIRRILSRKEELLAQVDNLLQDKEIVLRTQQDQLEAELFKYTSSRDFVENVLLHGNEAEIILLREPMNERLRELNSIKLDYKEPEENDVIDYIRDLDEVERVAKTMGYITTTKTFVASCSARGLGVRSGKVGVESSFVVETRDCLGNTVVEGEHCQPFQVKIQAPEGFFLGYKVINNKDGTVRIRYTPVTKGKHHLSVAIRGRELSGSPFTVNVVEGIDYNGVSSVFMKIGSQGTKSGEFKQPCSVATDKEGNIYITDVVNCRVQKFDSLGKHLQNLGTRGSKDGQFQNPFGVAVDSNGIIIVSDWDNHRVQLFSPEGKFIGKFGSKGSEEGKLSHPAGLALTKEGNLLVVDKDNHRLQLFKMDGTFLEAYSSNGNSEGSLSSPSHVTMTKDNGYLVTDTENNRVVKFSAGGKYEFGFGTKGNGNGEFDRPTGIAIDPEGFIIVGDFQNHRVQVFRPNGTFFALFGSEGDQEGEFKFPSGLALTNDGHVMVADRYNHRLQVF